jgi:flagellar biosynthesis protein FlhA
MGEFFVSDLESAPGVIDAITLDPRIEQHLLGRVQRTAYDLTLTLDPQLAQHLLSEIGSRLGDMVARGLQPILVTTTEIRLPFKRFFEPSLPKLAVLAYQELPARVEIRNFGIVTLPAGGLRSGAAPAAAPVAAAA